MLAACFTGTCCVTILEFQYNTRDGKFVWKFVVYSVILGGTTDQGYIPCVLGKRFRGNGRLVECGFGELWNGKIICRKCRRIDNRRVLLGGYIVYGSRFYVQAISWAIFRTVRRRRDGCSVIPCRYAGNFVWTRPDAWSSPNEICDLGKNSFSSALQPSAPACRPFNGKLKIINVLDYLNEFLRL